MKNGIAYHLERNRKQKWFVIKAFDGDTQVGYIHLGLEDREDPVEGTVYEWEGCKKVQQLLEYDDGAVILYRLNVEESHQRRGIGTHLMKMALMQSQDQFHFYGIFVEAGISAINPSITLKTLIKFYRNAGFDLWQVNDSKDMAAMYMAVEDIWAANIPSSKRCK